MPSFLFRNHRTIKIHFILTRHFGGFLAFEKDFFDFFWPKLKQAKSNIDKKKQRNSKQRKDED